MGTALSLWLLASIVTAPLIGGVLMTTEQRQNWIMRQCVDIGLFIANQDGMRPAVEYMLSHNIPTTVISRVLHVLNEE